MLKYTRVLLQLKIMTIACIGFEIKPTVSLSLLYTDGYSLQLCIPAALHIPQAGISVAGSVNAWRWDTPIYQCLHPNSFSHILWTMLFHHPDHKLLENVEFKKENTALYLILYSIL